MKKNNALRNYLNLFLCFSTGIILIYSCKKQTVKEQVDDYDQNQIKQWYNSKVDKSESNRFSTLSPIWETVSVKEQSGQLIFELNLNNPNKIFIGDHLTDKKNASELSTRTNTRIIIFKDKKSGLITDGCYMSAVNEDTNHDLKSIRYKKVGNFSGRIYYHDLNGTFANGWSYSNGLISGTVLASTKEDYLQFQKIALSSNEKRRIKRDKLSRDPGISCYTAAVPVWGSTCVDSYGCEYYITGYDYITNCTTEGGGGGGDNGGGYGPPTSGGNHGGGSGPLAPVIEIIKDSLQAKFPCAKTLVLDELEKITKYNKMVEPFLQKGFKPSITWNTRPQTWANGNYSGGTTGISEGSIRGMSSDITLNTEMMKNSSKLLIAAIAIHETYHAYINYMFANNVDPSLVTKSQPNYMAGLYQLIIYEKTGSNNNYVDHYNMLTSQLDNMTDILFTFSKGDYTVEECRKALLFGMDNPGPSPDFGQKQFIKQTYSDILEKYGYTAQSVANFQLDQINATAAKKLPTTGCQ